MIRPRWSGFFPRLGHVQYVIDSVAWEQIFSEYFIMRCQFSIRHLHHIHESRSLRRYAVSIMTGSLSNQLELQLLMVFQLVSSVDPRHLFYMSWSKFVPSAPRDGAESIRASRIALLRVHSCSFISSFCGNFHRAQELRFPLILSRN
jgi:hypothetical protein